MTQTCYICGSGVVETDDPETVKCPECGRVQEAE